MQHENVGDIVGVDSSSQLSLRIRWSSVREGLNFRLVNIFHINILLELSTYFCCQQATSSGDQELRQWRERMAEWLARQSAPAYAVVPSAEADGSHPVSERVDNRERDDFELLAQALATVYPPQPVPHAALGSLPGVGGNTNAASTSAAQHPGAESLQGFLSLLMGGGMNHEDATDRSTHEEAPWPATAARHTSREEQEAMAGLEQLKTTSGEVVVAKATFIKESGRAKRRLVAVTDSDDSLGNQVIIAW